MRVCLLPLISAQEEFFYGVLFAANDRWTGKVFPRRSVCCHRLTCQDSFPMEVCFLVTTDTSGESYQGGIFAAHDTHTGSVLSYGFVCCFFGFVIKRDSAKCQRAPGTEIADFMGCPFAVLAVVLENTNEEC